MALLEVIIPIKNRVEVKECISSLIHAANENISITLCDGGSSDPECVQILQELIQSEIVRIIHYPIQGFNKAELLNQAISRSQADLLLISDADIIWNQETLTVLIDKVLSEDKIICHVQNVKESNPTSIALRRDRYSYTIYTNGNIAIVEFLPEPFSEGRNRPGCGLICACRKTLLELGGYKELFNGWGWEDQDLLIRARICGIPIYSEGCVVHISHSDTLRNMHNGYVQPSLTRNKNIVACADSLSNGVVLGDLYTGLTQSLKHEIQVRLPDILI